MTKLPGRVMKFDPTVTTGNLITAGGFLVAAAVSWTTLTTRIDASDLRQTAQRAEFMQAITDMREAVREQRVETKELQKSVNAITTDTALIRGRLAGGDIPAGQRK